MSNDLLGDLAAEMDELPPPADAEDRLDKLNALARRVLKIDEQLEELDRRAAERRAIRTDILQKQMIDLMDMPGSEVEEVSVDGKRFVVEDHYHASIPKERRDEAHALLEENEAGDLIKYEVTATFGKDSQEQVEALTVYITQRYQDAQVDVNRGVPWKRLTSWLKEQFARRKARDQLLLGLDDEEMKKVEKTIPAVWIPPLDVVGGFVGRVVKVEDSAKKKRSR